MNRIRDPPQKIRNKKREINSKNFREYFMKYKL